MPEPAISPRVNPSDETIRFAGLTIRFLLTGEQANASVATFELSVPASERLPAPAHVHAMRPPVLNDRDKGRPSRSSSPDRCRHASAETGS